MKKILVTTFVACALVASALAQGTITFNVSAGNIKYTTDGTTLTSFPAGNPATLATFGKLNIGLYGNANSAATISLLPSGVPDLTGWSLATPIISQIAPSAGAVPAKIVEMPGTPGLPIRLEVVAWTGDFASFNAAAAAGALVAWSGDARSGGALGWAQNTGTAQLSEPMLKGATAYNSLVLAPVAPIPEPSTFALAALGGLALIFRRRN